MGNYKQAKKVYPIKECATEDCVVQFQPRTHSHKYCDDCISDRNRGRSRAYSKKYRERLRKEAVEAYGGKCVCCGESEYKFLELDHVNNDGNIHRQSGLLSVGLYKWLKDNDYPPSLQILCGNCHRAKTSFGTCPHQEEG